MKKVVAKLKGIVIQWNLSKKATSGPIVMKHDLYREVAALYTEVNYNVVVLFEAREAGWFREVAA